MATLYTDGTTAATIGEVETYTSELRTATSAATVTSVEAMIAENEKFAGATVAGTNDEVWVRITVPDTTEWKVGFVDFLDASDSMGRKESDRVVYVPIYRVQAALDFLLKLL